MEKKKTNQLSHSIKLNRELETEKLAQGEIFYLKWPEQTRSHRRKHPSTHRRHAIGPELEKESAISQAKFPVNSPTYKQRSLHFPPFSHPLLSYTHLFPFQQTKSQ